jgi:MFS family permease
VRDCTGVLWLLVAARGLQGLSAAILMAFTMALVAETVPSTMTGRALGLLGTISAIGTAFGPSMGGVLVAWLVWQAIFLINVPLGVVTYLLLSRWLLPDRLTPS